MAKGMNTKLMALTTAALALPALEPKSAQAQSAPENHSISYRFTQYAENDQPADSNASGDSAARYEIAVHQFSLISPVSKKFTIGLDAATETMSGASPWYVVEGSDGKPIQVMSGATIEESRDDYSVATNYYGSRARLGLGLSHSAENDYQSNSVNINTSFWSKNKNTTFDLGFGYSDDVINPTQDFVIDPIRVIQEEKTSGSVSIGFSQVLSKTTLFGIGVGLAAYEGYLSDPYKLVSVNGVVRRDARPDTKQQLSLDVKMRKYLTSIDAALHTDYRLYDNDWGVLSHTVEMALYKNIGNWQLHSRVRLYDQSAANFHQNFFTGEREDGFYSSDYRLSAYGAASVRLGLTKKFEQWAVKIAYESYVSGKGLESEGELSPALVDFNFASAGIDIDF